MSSTQKGGTKVVNISSSILIPIHVHYGVGSIFLKCKLFVAYVMVCMIVKQAENIRGRVAVK